MFPLGLQVWGVEIWCLRGVKSAVSGIPSYGYSSLNWGPFRGPFIRVPHYVGDLKRDPNLGNYPYDFYNRYP